MTTNMLEELATFHILVKEELYIDIPYFMIGFGL